MQTRQDPATTPTLRPIPRNGLAGASGLILCILLALSAAAVGVGVASIPMASVSASPAGGYVSEGFAGIVALVLTLYLWRVTRSAKATVPLLVVVGVLLIVETSSLLPAALLVGSVFALSEGAFLLAVLKRERLFLLPLIPLAAYGIAVLINRDPLASLAALAPFPPMIVLAVGTRHSAEREEGITRVGVICATSLAIALSGGIVAAVLLYRALGSLQPEILLEALESLREAAIEGQLASLSSHPRAEELKELFDYESVRNLVNSLFNLLPGLLILLCNLLAALAQMVLLATLQAFGFGASITDRVKAFRISLISALVFAAAYATAAFSGGGASTLSGTVAENLYLILLPGLALAGTLRLYGTLVRRGKRSYGCLFYLAILIPCLLFMAPALFAMFEVIGHLFDVIIDRLKPPDSDEDPFQ